MSSSSHVFCAFEKERTVTGPTFPFRSKGGVTRRELAPVMTWNVNSRETQRECTDLQAAWAASPRPWSMASGFLNAPTRHTYGDGWLGAIPTRAGGLPSTLKAFQSIAGSAYSPSDQLTSRPVFSDERMRGGAM